MVVSPLVEPKVFDYYLFQLISWKPVGFVAYVSFLLLAIWFNVIADNYGFISMLYVKITALDGFILIPVTWAYSTGH